MPGLLLLFVLNLPQIYLYEILMFGVAYHIKTLNYSYCHVEIQFISEGFFPLMIKVGGSYCK